MASAYGVDLLSSDVYSVGTKVLATKMQGTSANGRDILRENLHKNARKDIAVEEGPHVLTTKVQIHVQKIPFDYEILHMGENDEPVPVEDLNAVQ